MLLIAVLLAVVLFRSPPQEWARARSLGEYIESLGAVGVLVFLVLTALATSIGLPRQLFAFAGGFSFGIATGVMLSSFAAIVGCAITFFCSRRWLSEWVRSRYPNALSGLNALLREDSSSWLGYLPQMLVFALLGAGVRIGSNTYLVYGLSMLGLSLAMGLWLYKRAIKNANESSIPG